MRDTKALPDVLTLDPTTIDNAVLRRLIAEVQQETTAPLRAYDRVHNRHNRGGGRPTPPAPEPRPAPRRPRPAPPPQPTPTDEEEPPHG